MINPPSSTDINRIADWAELYIAHSKQSLSKSKMLSLLQKGDVNIDEDDVDSALQELNRRLSLYGRAKPYKLSGNIITPNFG